MELADFHSNAFVNHIVFISPCWRIIPLPSKIYWFTICRLVFFLFSSPFLFSVLLHVTTNLVVRNIGQPDISNARRNQIMRNNRISTWTFFFSVRTFAGCQIQSKSEFVLRFYEFLSPFLLRSWCAGNLAPVKWDKTNGYLDSGQKWIESRQKA